MNSVLSAKKIRKGFTLPDTKLELLKGVDLELQKGEAIAIMGKSGEGKSTLLHLLGTLEKPCSGELIICGKNTKEHSLSKLRGQHVGFIFQSYHLLDECTALENVLMPAKIARLPTHKGTPAYARAQSLLEAVGLLNRAHFFTKVLSGGEKQRVAIARALCNDPEIILADEPSGNLDHAHSQMIHQLLLNLVKRFGKSLIVVTHDHELSKLCDRTVLLKDGVLSP